MDEGIIKTFGTRDRLTRQGSLSEKILHRYSPLAGKEGGMERSRRGRS